MKVVESCGDVWQKNYEGREADTGNAKQNIPIAEIMKLLFMEGVT